MPLAQASPGAHLKDANAKDGEQQQSSSQPKQQSPKPPRTRNEEVFGLFLKDGTIVEAIYNEDAQPSCQFLISAPDGSVRVADSYKVGGKTILPPYRQIKLLQSATAMLPSGIEDYGSPEALLQRIEQYLQRYIDLSRFDLSLIANYLMTSWLWDRWSACGYLRFKGEPDTGKTRMLETAQQVLYRAVHMGVKPTKAAFFRRADAVRGGMIIDEADMDGDLKDDFIQMLNAGYKRNGVHTACVKAGRDWEPETFHVGGCKVLANQRDFPDRALETRCFTICTVSKPLSPDIPIEYDDHFYSEGMRLRNMLLKFRIDTLRTTESNEEPLRHLNGRTAQIGLPLYSVSPDREFKREFMEYLQARHNGLREVDPLQIVMEAIAQESGGNAARRISLSEVGAKARRLGSELDVAPSELGGRRVADLVRSLQFEIVKSNGWRHIVLNPKNLDMQLQRFGLAGTQGS